MMYKLSVCHAKIFYDFFASMAGFFYKIWPNFLLNRSEIGCRNSAALSANSAEFRISKKFLFLSHVRCISAEFFRFSPIFSEFYKM
jgi:hypothetical protein